MGHRCGMIPLALLHPTTQTVRRRLGLGVMIRKPKMTEEDELILWLGSFRYYCGRMTIAVGAFCELLRFRWPCLPQKVRDLIQRDLEAEYERDDANRRQHIALGTKPTHLPLGMDCDRAEWDKVRALWKKP